MVRGVFYKSKSLYSLWHRKRLPNKCYTCDLDMVEYRFVKGKRVVVAIMDTKHWSSGDTEKVQYPTQESTAIYCHIAEFLDVPYFCVNDNINEDNYEASKFYVSPMNDKAKNIFGENPQLMSESEYRHWIESL